MYENIKMQEIKPVSGTAAAFLKGVLIAAALTFLIFALSAVLLSYTPMTEGAIPYIAFATQILASFVSGFFPAKRAGTKGLITGSLSALIYMLIVWLAASLAADGFYVNSHVLTMFLTGILSGAVGGITGVNFKDTVSNKKKR